MNTLILGLGNLILRDEGVGIHVIQCLEKESLPAGTDLLDGGTGGFHLIGTLQEYDTIIMIDATLDGNLPGTIRLLHPHYASDFPPLLSAHEIGLRDMIEAMILTNNLPQIHLITVSVANISEVGMTLTPEIEAVVKKVADFVKELV